MYVMDFFVVRMVSRLRYNFLMMIRNGENIFTNTAGVSCLDKLLSNVFFSSNY